MDQMNNTNELPPLPEIELADFKNLCQKTWEQRKVVDSLQVELNIQTAELTKLKDIVLGYMEKYSMKNFHVPGMGKLVSRDNLNVAMPKETSKRDALFNYLKEVGDFENIITIHSKTLVSYWREKFEQAKKEGNVDFAIPGLDNIETLKTLTMIKGE